MPALPVLPSHGASIRLKLSALTAFVVAIIVGALAIYFPSRELRDLDQERISRASTYAALLSNQLRGALGHGDRAAASEVLAALASDPEVVAISLYRNAGPELFQHGQLAAWIDPAHTGAIERQVLRGGERVAAVAPVESPDGARGTLVIELSGARIAAYQARLTRTALGVGGAAIAFGAIAAYLIARSLVRRLRAIVEVACSVATDSAPCQVPIEARDEIGVLGLAFNHMVQRVQVDRTRLHKTVADLTATEEQLARTNRELEQRVTARTTALSDANRQLKLEMKHRSAMEIELRQAQKLESVGRLASGIAHEINTPVQFVNDSCAFLETASEELIRVVRLDGELFDALGAQRLTLDKALARRRALEAELDVSYLSEQIPLAVQRSLQGLTRVTDIVRAMKEFAYPDRVEQALADINRAIASTLTVARTEYKYVAELETDYGDLPMVTCHIGELNQVVLNMVVNSAHAIEAQHLETMGKIIVRTRAAGDQIQIIVEDNGAGIPEAVIDKIFDPFFTTKEIGKGTGQGLAIARTVVVDKHHGKLEVDSRVGVGTRFTITLPVHGIPHARGTTQVAALTRPPGMRG